MNGNRLSNLLVWWLVPSLFVVTASQCGSKKKMNSRGSANSASGSPGKRSETSSPSREAEGNGDSDTTAHSDESERQRSLGAIRRLTGELKQFLEEGAYKGFLGEVADERNKNSSGQPNPNIECLSAESWRGYYKPCSRIWMCLVQRGLVVVKGSKAQLNFGSSGVSGIQDAPTILLHLAMFLLNRLDWEGLKPYIVHNENGVEGKKSIIYSLSIRKFIKESSFKTSVGDGSLVQFLKQQELQGSNPWECLIDPEELEEDFGKVLASLNVDENRTINFYWYWTVGSAIGRLTLILTKIEQHLEVLFGKGLVNYRGELDGD